MDVFLFVIWSDALLLFASSSNEWLFLLSPEIGCNHSLEMIMWYLGVGGPINDFFRVSDMVGVCVFLKSLDPFVTLLYDQISFAFCCQLEIFQPFIV